MNDTLDSPVKYAYSNGKMFPSNAIVIGYILLTASLFSLAVGSWIIAIILAPISGLIAFSYSTVSFDPEKKQIQEMNYFVGFIPVVNTLNASQWTYLTVIPQKRISTMYASTSNSTTITEYYFVLTLLNQHYRNKKELVWFESKVDAVEVAKALSQPMELTYFEYDPGVIRSYYTRK